MVRSIQTRDRNIPRNNWATIPAGALCEFSISQPHTVPAGLMLSGILVDLIELWDRGTGAYKIPAPHDAMVSGSA
jgi:hypothetical protein